MRVVDVMLSFPSQIMILAVVALMGVNIENVIIANIFIKWAWYARMIRTAVVKYTESNFILYSKSIGSGNYFILTHHMLPCIAAELAVLASLDTGWAILNISTLSFLGLGVQAPMPEWGAMLNEAKNVMISNPEQMLVPGIAVVVLVGAFNLLGDSLRDALDPKGGSSLMSQQSVLDVQDLYVTFHQDKKSAELVKGVSFSVAPGECLGILGESGSGKSMTAKAMLGLLDRSFEVRGKVFFQGESLLEKDADALRRLRGSRICMVLQNPMSCFDPLYRIGAQMAETFQEHTDWSSAEIRAKSIEVLKLMKIRDPEDVLRKYPHQMSGGMLQRVMIGLALALKPSLIICDEPTTAIDSISQYAIMQEFLRIKTSRSAAMIFISHDLGVLSLISDKLVVMHRGLAVERGLPEEIF